VFSVYDQTFALFCECCLVVSDVDFRMESKSWKQRLRKRLKTHSEVVKRSFSRAHTQTVDIRLSTNGTRFIISVPSTAEFMVVMRLSHTAAALTTADVHSTQMLLLQSIRNGLTGLFLYPMLTANFVSRAVVSAVVVFTGVGVFNS